MLGRYSGAVTTVATEMFGYRALKSQRKGSTWWSDEIKETRNEEECTKENAAKECGRRNKTEEKNRVHKLLNRGKGDGEKE